MIKMAIVGCGRISGLHARAYLEHPDSDIVAICDTSEANLREKGELWGVSDNRRFTNVDDLLAIEEVDAVDVLVPHHLHYSFATKVMMAGKHLSLQKPMTVSLAEADELIALAHKQGVVFKVFENFIFYEPIVFAKSLVDQGEIGDLLGIRMKSHSGYSPDMWEIPADTQAWRLNPEECGGGPLVFDDGHHKFAVAWHFLGAVDQMFSSIGNWQNTGIDSPSIAAWRHSNGSIGSLEVIYSPEMLVSTRYYAQDDQLELTGTKGTIWVTKGHGQLVHQAPVRMYRDGHETHYENLDYDWGNSFVASGQHFIDALMAGTAPLLTGEQGKEVLEITLRAQQA